MRRCVIFNSNIAKMTLATFEQMSVTFEYFEHMPIILRSLRKY